MIKLQNHNAHKKKNVWSSGAQRDTWKNNRQSKNTGEIKKQKNNSHTVLCTFAEMGFIRGTTFLSMGLKHCTSYNRYYCKDTPQCVGVYPLF